MLTAVSFIYIPPPTHAVYPANINSVGKILFPKAFPIIPLNVCDLPVCYLIYL